jgi:SAM-dependent methyltransferase
MNEIQLLPSATPDYTRENASFWDDLCGSVLAQSLGITDASGPSLARFDRAYLALYPYLLGYVRPAELRGRRVIEIGLGYGTLGQQLIDAGARYTGIDVARGPAAMMNHRAELRERPRCAIQGSMLVLPVQDESVECVISIGCFHHTGSIEQCIRETHRVLKPGGVAVVMVYNQFSYRHWMRWPIATARAWFNDSSAGSTASAPEHQRRKYDANVKGMAAPETVFVSASRLGRLFGMFRSVEIAKENNTNLFRFIPRDLLLTTLGRWAGLDLYVRAVK